METSNRGKTVPALRPSNRYEGAMEVHQTGPRHLRRSTRQSSSPKPALAAPTGNRQPVTPATAVPPAGAQDLHLVLVVNCAQAQV